MKKTSWIYLFLIVLFIGLESVTLILIRKYPSTFTSSPESLIVLSALNCMIIFFSGLAINNISKDAASLLIENNFNLKNNYKLILVGLLFIFISYFTAIKFYALGIAFILFNALMIFFIKNNILISDKLKVTQDKKYFLMLKIFTFNIVWWVIPLFIDAQNTYLKIPVQEYVSIVSIYFIVVIILKLLPLLKSSESSSKLHNNKHILIYYIGILSVYTYFFFDDLIQIITGKFSTLQFKITIVLIVLLIIINSYSWFKFKKDKYSNILCILPKYQLIFALFLFCCSFTFFINSEYIEIINSIIGYIILAFDIFVIIFSVHILKRLY